MSLIFGSLVIPAYAEVGYDSNTVFKIMDNTNITDIKAKGAILIDGATGSVLFEKNSHDKLPIASITKAMTMLLVMEAIDSGKIKFEDKVNVSEHSYDMGGSQVWLKPGEVFTVHEMMEAVAIHSANDAAVAISEYVSGSEDVFVTAMNEKAKALGMVDTYFLDCTGLTDVGHYSSAYDIALLSRELLIKHPKITQYTKTWHSLFRSNDKEHEVSLDNTNKLIHHYSGAIGLKTGFTTKAGHCLSAAAVRNKQMAIAVVLGEPDSNTRWAESRKLMDYAFANFETSLVNKKGEEVKQVEIKKGLSLSVKGIYANDVSLLLKKGDKGKIEHNVKINENITAPIKAGQKLGEVIYLMNGKEIGTAQIVAEKNVEKASFIRLFFRMVFSWAGAGKS
jgi:serine-type D-Ala-D-Ala carboxypeptidase (penicillin-binding protein 5/6)